MLCYIGRSVRRGTCGYWHGTDLSPEPTQGSSGHFRQVPLALASAARLCVLSSPWELRSVRLCSTGAVGAGGCSSSCEWCTQEQQLPCWGRGWLAPGHGGNVRLGQISSGCLTASLEIPGTPVQKRYLNVALCFTRSLQKVPPVTGLLFGSKSHDQHNPETTDLHLPVKHFLAADLPCKTRLYSTTLNASLYRQHLSFPRSQELHSLLLPKPIPSDSMRI
ncbi:hypothetical protein DV515_00014707 [Chloebia gouldiae]|uniref:Uncharacterized protein n=1 Tax=Chloebia gouldiae TaxID=44316 RepID=A0A3L8RXE3_CHLGU|nr:hypothetical protein DV515_00014707 [Chloebia gouldiae]